jgi:hypothetical protein
MSEHDEPRTCHDCDAPLGTDPFTMLRSLPHGRFQVGLCPDCAAPYRDEYIGIDEEDEAYSLWREMTR